MLLSKGLKNIMGNKINLKRLKKLKVIQLIEPSINIMKSYLGKSEESLLSSKFLLEKGQYNDSIALSYFSMYNSLLALSYQCGIKSENHNASIFLLKKVYNIDNKNIMNAKSERKDKQYYPSLSTDKKEVLIAVESAEEFNLEIENFILNLNTKKIANYRKLFEELIK